MSFRKAKAEGKLGYQFSEEVETKQVNLKVQKCITRRKIASCEHCLWYNKNCPLLNKEEI